MIPAFISQCLRVGTSVQYTSVRYVRNKHRVLKWRELRGKKFLKIDLPDYNDLRKEQAGQLSPEEIRTRMKKEGMAPTRIYNERPIFISATDAIFEPYVPPEGDGRMSSLSKAGAKQRFELIEKKGRSVLALRKLRKFDEDFDSGEFAARAQEIYIDAHNNLVKEDMEELHDLVTELCFPDFTHGAKNKTIRWTWHDELEPPRTMQVRTAPMLHKTNLYAQITVRIHSRQSLAVYDRFGRLMYGSEDMIKDVLEYVVFEKHLNNPYGKWRMHSKIVPSWAPPRDPVLRTFKKPVLTAPSEEYLAKEREKQKIKDEDLEEEEKTGSDSPQKPDATPQIAHA